MDNNIELLKELLETGVITQEEYDAKVEQLSPVTEEVEKEKELERTSVDYDELKKLEELKQEGIISHDEYSQKVAQMLNISVPQYASSKENFNLFQWIKRNVAAVILIAVLAGAVVFMAPQFLTQQSTISAINEKLEKKDKEVKRVYNDKAKLSTKVSKYEDALGFYMNYVGICPENDKYYHRYSCPSLPDSFSYWVYNIDAAKHQGFSPCPKCFKTEVWYYLEENL